MLKTKSLIANVNEVPTNWVFNRYLTKCPVLTGQGVMIKSIFSDTDTRPSMSIFVRNGKYRFNDFSTGIKGGAVDLIMEIYKYKGEPKSFGFVADKIVEDYNNYLLTGNGIGIAEFKERAKYKPVSYPIRNWDKTDDNYWKQFELKQEDVAFYKAFPLESYTLSNGEKILKVQGFHIYGYFCNDGLYKIYQPLVAERKFMKVLNYIQGIEQLTYKEDFLVITKALKDMACLHKMFPQGGYVAPESENTLIKESVMKGFKDVYGDKIVTNFDLDPAGVSAALKYKELYGIEPLVSGFMSNFPWKKDTSDTIKAHGGQHVKHVLGTLLWGKFLV